MVAIERKVVVSGKGKTKQQAFGVALNGVQTALSKSEKGTIIRIEPIDIKILEATDTIETERFMMLFFKRDRHVYFCKLEVNVNAFVVDVEGVDFKQTRKPEAINGILNLGAARIDAFFGRKTDG